MVPGACSDLAASHHIGKAFSINEPDVETSLYEPVKRFLEQLGYAVKGEVGNCDVVGVRDDAPSVLVICELKLTFNLELVLQGVDRATAADEIWLAAQLSVRGKGRESDPRYRNLCRRLGFGCWECPHRGKWTFLSLRSLPCPERTHGAVRG